MALPRDELLALIERIKEQDKEIHAWRAFPDENALNCPPNGEFQNGELLETAKYCLPGEGRGPILFADQSFTKRGYRPSPVRQEFLEVPNAVGPLSGLTVGVKDIIDVAGIPTRHGSAIYENAPPALADAECVRLMRAAGATIVGKTVTTELATFVPSATRNPRNLAHTPGGSSSGSAAAVAAGHVDIAIGTQTAGSIIRPAAYCGVFGFKPSFGLVPRGGVKIQSETLDTVGVFARSIEHCEAWLAAMMGTPDQESSRQAGSTALNIVVLADWLPLATDDMRAAVSVAATSLNAAGYRVRETALPASLATLLEDQAVIQNYEAPRAYLRLCEQHSSIITPLLLAELAKGIAIKDVRYESAVSAALAGRQLADELLGADEVWMMPAAAGAAPVTLASTGDPHFNRLASILGAPAITIPCADDTRGLPLGLQLLARRGNDKRLLRAAQTIFGVLRPTHGDSARRDR